MTNATISALQGTQIIRKKQTHFDLIWFEFKKNKMAIAGLIFLVIIFLVALFAKQIMPYDPLELDTDRKSVV